MADKQPSQMDIVKAQVQDLIGAANQMVGPGRLDYRAFQNTQNVLGASSPRDVIRQDFGTLRQQSRDAVPSMGVAYPHGLTAQEKYLFEHHLNNARHGGYVEQQGGGISTVRNITIEQDGKTYVIPTIWQGRQLSDDLAVQRARQVGLDQFPSYSSQEEAENRYQNTLHPMMEEDASKLRDIISYLRSHGRM